MYMYTVDGGGEEATGARQASDYALVEYSSEHASVP